MYQGTLIIIAILAVDLDAVRLLINKCVNLEYENIDNNRPIHCAVQLALQVPYTYKPILGGDYRSNNPFLTSDSVEILKIIVNYGVNLQCKNKKGDTHYNLAKKNRIVTNCLNRK